MKPKYKRIPLEMRLYFFGCNASKNVEWHAQMIASSFQLRGLNMWKKGFGSSETKWVISL